MAMRMQVSIYEDVVEVRDEFRPLTELPQAIGKHEVCESAVIYKRVAARWHALLCTGCGMREELPSMIVTYDHMKKYFYLLYEFHPELHRPQEPREKMLIARDAVTVVHAQNEKEWQEYPLMEAV
jgi:hypothetical protein